VAIAYLRSTKLMLATPSLLTLGCALQVSSETLAYERSLNSAWSRLPVSAVPEMIAVTLFASNLILTFMSEHPIQLGMAYVETATRSQSEASGTNLLGVRQVLLHLRPWLRKWDDPESASGGIVR
jgi:hypothetical protein